MIKDKNHYAIIMDERRADMMNIMIECAYEGTDQKYFFAKLKHFGLKETYEDYVKEISRKEHELGWCKDPNCKNDDKENS